jgi:hypothetical protein
MNFRIEVTKPTKPADLKAALEAARDAWLDSTPQESDNDPSVVGSVAHAAEAINDARANPSAKETAAAATLRNAVAAHAAAIKAKSATLDVAHTVSLALINAGIAAAVVMASGDVPVRASVVGHFDVSLDGIRKRPATRVIAEVDAAG